MQHYPSHRNFQHLGCTPHAPTREKYLQVHDVTNALSFHIKSSLDSGNEATFSFLRDPYGVRLGVSFC